MSQNGPDYSKMCFVIMPFGKKPVRARNILGIPLGSRHADFDAIYLNIFKPAIEATRLPEGGFLIPFRTDMNPAASVIDVEMFRGINYARMVLSDISGLNPNVFYELGARHQSNETGTAIFRQSDSPIPFDISHIKAVPYAYHPPENIGQARTMITNVLAESLCQNLITSPIQLAIQVQRRLPQDVQVAMKTAEEAIRRQDFEAALLAFKNALKHAPNDALLHFKLGLMSKYKADWTAAAANFQAAIQCSPKYAEAYRELGIAQNKLLNANSTPNFPTGEQSLRRAVELNPADFDAHSSLGGVLKRKSDLADALKHYKIATDLSAGHPYPLLNALKIQSALDENLNLDDRTRFLLERAKIFRLSHAKNRPPIESPWCYFDLAEIRLYEGSSEDFLKLIHRGTIAKGTMSWQAKTFRQSLELLRAANYNPPGLSQAIEKLINAETWLPKSGS